MFEKLTDRLSKTLRNIKGTGKLTAENIKETLTEIEHSLLEADVALSVVEKFISEVKNKTLGQEVDKNLSPAQFFTKIVNDELTQIMGEVNTSLNLKATPPAVIIVAGLQGSGKTTTIAKLAKYLKEKEKKSVLVASCDIYRPAAIEQLETLASQVDATFFPSTIEQKPVNIAKDAISSAKKQFKDVVIIDTAGRLHIDNDMMQEIKEIHKAINPIETLFIVDSMTGQDAANTAKAFDDALPLTGVILTKTDGDARGGAALSIRYITQKPVKFLGVGEKVDALEAFYPDRIASRILGMGDVLSLVEEIQEKVDKNKAEKLAKKLSKGKKFDLDDLRDQLKQMMQMGGMAGMLDKIPGMGAIPEAAKSKLDDKQLIKMIAVIDSMTKKERMFPNLIKTSGSRKKRVTQGSGTNVKDINSLLKQHEKMQKMAKKLSNKAGMMKMMNALQGKLPPGMFG